MSKENLEKIKEITYVIALIVKNNVENYVNTNYNIIIRDFY